MRALVFKGFGSGDNLALEVRPRPDPGPGEVRVRVRAFGANASDRAFVTGVPVFARIARWSMRGRAVSGSDVLGVVEALDPGCTRLKPGDRVLADTFGSQAEYCVAWEALFVPVPGALAELLAMVEDGRLTPVAGEVTSLDCAKQTRPGLLGRCQGASKHQVYQGLVLSNQPRA